MLDKEEPMKVRALYFALALIVMAGLMPALASPVLAIGAFGTNLIINGDAESGIGGGGEVVSVPGWTTTGGFTVIKYGNPNWLPTNCPGPANRGSNYFVGGSQTGNTKAAQSIDVSFGMAAIDAGYVGFNLSGYLGGWVADNDMFLLAAFFKDASGGVLARALTGPVLAFDRNSVSGLIYKESLGSVPVGTRSIDILLQATRTNGNDDDGYADNLSLVLRNVAEQNPGMMSNLVPEPGSIAVLLLGAGGLWGIWRRRR